MTGKPHEEWLKQADYDMETAEALLQAGRYPYVVFMCHLSLEKALKGLYRARLGKVPPRTHNLIFLLKAVGMKPEPGADMVLATLTQAQPATRYPDTLVDLQSSYTQAAAEELLARSREVLEWIRRQF